MIANGKGENMRKKLSEDVSVREMRELREDGLTNRQIAEKLDCTYQTVLRYIGRQPEGMRGERRPRGEAKEPKQPPASLSPESRLTLFSRSYRGKCAEFVLSKEDVILTFAGTEAMLSLQEFAELAKDVVAVSALV